MVDGVGETTPLSPALVLVLALVSALALATGAKAMVEAGGARVDDGAEADGCDRTPP